MVPEQGAGREGIESALRGEDSASKLTTAMAAWYPEYVKTRKTVWLSRVRVMICRPCLNKANEIDRDGQTDRHADSLLWR